MKKTPTRFVMPFLILLVCLTPLFNSGQTTLTYTFTSSTQTFVVPACVISLSVTLRGAQGGNNVQQGGYGGLIKGVATVTPGQVFYINVGEQSTSSLGVGGYNGGGNGGVSSLAVGKGGGGATDLRTGGNALTNRIFVAGGGGGTSANPNSSIQSGGYGGAGNSCTSPLGVGGGGGNGGTQGGSGGCSGGTAANYGSGGAGGGLTSGGALTGLGSGGYGQAGSLGQGGNGGDYAATYGGTVGSTYGGGGGGGGYYGGAGGMGVGAATGGGGGGSSYADNSLFSNVSFSSSITYTGDGYAIISYVINNPVTISTPTLALCTGNSFVLNAGSNTSYTWSTGANTSSILITPTANVSYTVSGTNSLGCVTTAVSNVTINTVAPTLSISASATQICLGNTLSLVASGAASYSWSNGVINGQAFSPTVTGNYSVNASNGCGNSNAQVSISVTPVPVSISALTSSICAGSSIILTASSTGTAYSWQPTGAVTQSLLVSPSANTIYTVTANSGVCIGRATFSLAVLPSPTLISTSTSSSVCDGSPLVLTASGANNYTWNPGNVATPSVIVNPSVTTQYTVTGTNSVGCSGTSLQNILVYPNPVLTVISSNFILCNGNSATLSVSGANSYSWSNGGSSSLTVVNPTLSTVYNVTGTNLTTGCFSNASVSVNVFSPSVSVSGNTVICNGATASLVASGANTYTWSNGVLFAGLNVTPSLTTMYLLNSVSYSSSVGCLKTTSVLVTVNPNPTLIVSSNKILICLGESVTFSVSGANTYTWSNLSNNTTLIEQPPIIGTLTYSVSGSNNFGCTHAAPITITVAACNSLFSQDKTEEVFRLFPNPAFDKFMIQTSAGGTIIIRNQLGEMIKKITLTETQEQEISMDGLSPGLYFIELENGQKKFAKKILIKD